ncbi:MAG TPA: hypothetical protein DCZ11_03185 [Gammaproteobacteria bacterium]|nr:hypothetical protein [Gammaproteobacteria bacterium]MCH77430.1 hypothetical protein [Gammaproteobacteria bacterium]
MAFNRGIISRRGLARVDLKRTALSAETMVNWMPRVLGSMSMRPGLGYLFTLPGATKTVPFIFSASDTAAVHVSGEQTRVSVDDELVERPLVTAAFTNGTFTSDLTGWTSVDAGTVNAWQTGGYLGLAGDGTNVARRRQAVTVNEPNVEHGVRVVVARGPLKIRIGSTSGGSEYLADTELNTGEHSFAFTPTGASFSVDFFNQNDRLALLDSIAVESAGAMVLGSPWAAADLTLLRHDQSGDIIFVACDGYRQRKIVRWGARSWGVEEYLADDGPFRVENTGTTTITPSGLSGNITLTSSAVAGSGIFRGTHVGALFRLTSAGQTVSDSFSAENDFSTHIRVTGTGESRRFGVTIEGTFTATVTLQRSVDEGASWQDVSTWTTPVSTTYLDGLDDQIIWYRIGVKTGDYSSGVADCTLVYSSGSITGVARVTAYTSSTVVSAEVLSPLGGTAATDVWAEGAWSDFRGWPSAVRFHDGRLFWAGKDKFWGSVTDQFYTFDPDFEGDAGPINRSIGYGPVDTINWLMSLGRLIAGGAMAEISCRSSSFNEPLTPTNFTPKNTSTQGSSPVAAVQIDEKGLFVQRNGATVYEMSYNVDGDDYKPDELTKLVPELCESGITVLAVQRKPDTRVHCRLADGTVAVMIYDRVENVVCWVKVETDGSVEDVCTLPGTSEDAVYYTVKRTIGGADVYYHERWALESEARGAAVSKMADSFVYAAASADIITGLDHLEGEEVVAWGGGADLGTFTVSGGAITLPSACTHRCAGLTYSARFKSGKLAYSFPGRSGLGLAKKIAKVGLVMADVHAQGLQHGPDFNTLDPLPEVEAYAAVDQDAVRDAYDEQAIWFRSQWSTDARLCLKATAPRPCTVLAAAVELDTNG